VNVRESLLQERIDPALTPGALSEIAGAALGESVRVRAWHPLTGGCWNRVIGLEGGAAAERLVIKIAPTPGDAGLTREFAVLRWFTEHTRLPVPRALHVDASGRLVPGSLLVMEKVPGRVLHGVFPYLSEDQRRRITRNIAEDVAELHRATAKGFGGVELPEPERRDWPSFWLQRFDAAVAQASESTAVDPRLLERICTVRPGLPALLQIGGTATLTHYDIWSGNIMVDTDGGAVRVSGYLDGPGFWADPVRELSFAEMFGIADALFYQVYTSVHALPEGWRTRRDLYNLKMHLKHIMMYPGERYYREGAEQCLRTVEKA
jgi:fructosamine-3-kinase